MNEVRYEDRYANWDGNDRCCYCLDTGLVTVALRDPTPATINRAGKPVQMMTALERAQAAGASEAGLRYEEEGPCPMCQIGYRVEFPAPSERVPDPGPGPWGRDGYWRGRDVFDVTPLESPSSKPLPKPENAKKMRELAERMSGVGKSM